MFVSREPRVDGLFQPGIPAIVNIPSPFPFPPQHSLPATPTPVSRYPASLSQRPGPSRYTRPSRPAAPADVNSKTDKTAHQYNPGSIDDVVQPSALLASLQSAPAQPPTPVQQSYEYSSLADLLQQAGYKETRVYTPESEKRIIKRTLDEDDEINALYGAFGLVPSTSSTLGPAGQRNTSFAASGLRNVHRRQTITEPSMPMKSSSSLLRRLALQDLPDNADNNAGGAERVGVDGKGGAAGAEDGWWAGGIGIAASLGRAAKSIMDKPSPPTRYTSPSSASSGSPAQVGLGIASGGQAVRKVRSNFEMDRRRGVSEEPVDKSKGRITVAQEQRAPIRAVSESPKRNPVFSGASDTINAAAGPSPLRIETMFDSAPPACDEDAFGFSPLPLDYEDQCDDDELYGAMESFGVGSLGSADSRSTSGSSATSRRGRVNAGLGLGVDGDDSIEMTIAVGGEGQRIMLDAVEYDEEFDSPSSHTLVLPSVDDDEGDSDADCETISIPVPPMPNTTARPDVRRMSTEPEVPVQQTSKPATKYSDRATKLRMARSTPVLKKQQSGWFDSIRSVVASRAGYSQVDTEIPPVPVSTLRGPMRISPAIPAAPTLITASPVICDSTSAEAEDLPAIPPSITVTSEGSSAPSSSYVPLRLRSSLAALRMAVGMPERKSSKDGEGDTPVLSPRLDWKAQGSQFAGWERGKHGFDSPRRVASTGNEIAVDGLGLGMGARSTSGATIDYSKSFFFKPATPPHPSHRTDEAGSTASTLSTASSVSVSSSASTYTDRTDDGGRDAESEQPTAPQADRAPKEKEPSLNKRRSIKSLRAALLLPVAPPPVPALPAGFKNGLSTPRTPPTHPKDVSALAGAIQPPMLAISSPGAWEAGLPPRELVLEGEEWDARDGGGVPGEWGRRGRGRSGGKKKTLRKKKSVEA